MGSNTWLFFFIMVIAIIAFVVVAAMYIGMAMGALGAIWGAGASIVNYGKSIKVNLIDANR